MDSLVDGLEHSGIPGAVKGFRKGIGIMRKIPYDRSRRKPRVLIVGEYLLNFHPGANHDIEKYLENNGFEVIEAKMTDVIRKTYFYQDKQIQEYHLNRGITRGPGCIRRIISLILPMILQTGSRRNILFMSLL